MTAASVSTGASFTAVTLSTTVAVLLTVVPSVAWKVNASGPLKFAAGV